MVEKEESEIVSRIKKLLALADNQAGLPEGEIAAKVAERMMREHAITQDQLVDKENIVQFMPEIGRSNWLRNLLFDVAKFCSCKSWIMSGTKSMGIAGYESDIEIAGYLFQLIQRQIEKECERYMRYHPIGGKGVSNEFKMSAAEGVAAKLKAIKAASLGEDQVGTALVLSRYREVCSWADERMRFRQTKGPSFNHNSAGYKAGSNVRLSPGIGSSGTSNKIGPGPKLLKG